jgi:hypothetical protein
MIKAVSASEMSINLYQTTRRTNPEDRHFHIHSRDILKPHLTVHFLIVYLFAQTFPIYTCTYFYLLIYLLTCLLRFLTHKIFLFKPFYFMTNITQPGLV